MTRQTAHTITRSAGKFALLLAATLAIFAAPAVAQPAPQTSESEFRLINLVRQGDSGFNVLLDANFPDIRSLQGFQRLEPLLAIVHNESKQAAIAYMVKWTVRGADGSPFVASFVAMDHPANPGKMSGKQSILQPNEYELVSPYFYWSASQFPELLRRDIVATTLQADAARPLVSRVDGGQTIQASVDGAIYEDGLFVGPNTLKLYERFHADQQGERSEAKWVLDQIDRASDQLELGTALREQMQKGSMAADETDGASLTATARGAQAGRFYQELRKMGIGPVRISTIDLAKQVPLVLHRASTSASAE